MIGKSKSPARSILTRFFTDGDISKFAIADITSFNNFIDNGIEKIFKEVFPVVKISKPIKNADGVDVINRIVMSFEGVYPRKPRFHTGEKIFPTRCLNMSLPYNMSIESHGVLKNYQTVGNGEERLVGDYKTDTPITIGYISCKSYGLPCTS